MQDLRGKIVLITGGAHGIGKATAHKFGRQGSRLVIADIAEKLLAETARELRGAGIDVLPLIADLSHREEAEGIIDKTLDEWGRIDVLVNNAGVAHLNYIPELSVEEIRNTFDVNLFAPIWTTRRVMPHMRKRGSGHIVNIASLAGWNTAPHISMYSASKSALIAFTDATMLELHNTGVKATIIDPTYATTGMFTGVKPPLLMPWITPERVANAILKAVVRERSEVFVPRFFHVYAIGRVLLLPKIFYLLGRLLRSHKAHDKWVGHKLTD